MLYWLISGMFRSDLWSAFCLCLLVLNKSVSARFFGEGSDSSFCRRVNRDHNTNDIDAESQHINMSLFQSLVAGW